MLTAEYLLGRLNIQADLESRHIKDSSNWMLNQGTFKQINQKWGILEVDLFADRLYTQLPQYISWRPDLLGMATDAFQIKWHKVKGNASPLFLFDNKMLSKTAEGNGRDCNNISSMANTAILSNAPGTVNRQSDVITSTSRSAAFIGGLDVPTNTN